MTALDQDAARLGLLCAIAGFEFGETESQLYMQALYNGKGAPSFSAEPTEIAQRAIALCPTHDMYVGAAPRFANGQPVSGKKQACLRSWMLWADCDSDESLDQLAAFSVVPTFVVESGSLTDGGQAKLHAWWWLDEPLDVLETEQALRRLIAALDSDPARKDISSIMRVPGTVNHKAGRPVVCIEVNEPVSTAALLALLPDPAEARRDPACQAESLRALQERTAAVSEGERNDHLSKVAGGLARKHRDWEAVEREVRGENQKLVSPLPTAEVDKMLHASVRGWWEDARAKDGRRDFTAASAAEGDARELPPPSQPMRVARVLAEEKCTHPSGALLLRHWRDGWWRWRAAQWDELERQAVDTAARLFTEHATYAVLKQDGTTEAKPWAPTNAKVGNLLGALAAVVHLRETVEMPGWLDGRGAGQLVSCANGLLDVSTRELSEHSPLFFNSWSVPFDFQPDAPHPGRWLAFLASLWPEDEQSTAALQEWFGYVVSGRSDLQKVLLIVGPTRGGKGVIARTLGALVGRENVVGPTLSSLRGEFGLEPWIGKSLAVISDARIGGPADIVVERLLSISGEDTLTVNRKNRSMWTGKLPGRILICSNELPRLGDASAAIAGRFVTLMLEESWFGREDRELETDLAGELPGIFNWALEGLARLAERGHFTRPPSSDEALIDLQDLASPKAAFVRELCVVGPEEQAEKETLYRAWSGWAEDNGHHAGSLATFGRDLKAVLPKVHTARPGPRTHTRPRVYIGVGLRGMQQGRLGRGD